MSEKKAGMSKQQPVHLKINWRATLYLQLPHRSTLVLFLPPEGSKRIASLKGERTGASVHCKQGLRNPNTNHENAQREKTPNLYGHVAVGEFLKGKPRTPGDDCRSRNREQLILGCCNVLGSSKKKTGPNKGSSRNKGIPLSSLGSFTELSPQSFLVHFLQTFSVLHIFFPLCSTSLLLIHTSPSLRTILRGQNRQRYFLIKACGATAKLLFWTTVLQILVKG